MPACIKCGAELPEGAKFCPECGKRQTALPRKTLKRANGTGTVYKLEGRRKRPWVAAKSKVVLGYYPSKTEALEALSNVSGKPISERYNFTLADVYELWKGEKFRELTPSGQEQYRVAFKHLAPLHDMKFRNLRLEHYQAIIDEMARTGHKNSSTNKVKQLVGQLSKWAMREDITSKSYAPFIKLPEDEKTEKAIFTGEEVDLLFANDDDDIVKVILILIFTGLRIGELMGLEKSNVNLIENYLIGGSKTEAGKNRTVPIHSKIKPYIQKFYDAAPDGEPLMQGYSGNKTAANFRKRDFYPTLERLNISGKTPHSTRHTFASMMAQAGVRPEVLQKIIGHADYSTTANIYVHTDISELQSEIQKI